MRDMEESVAVEVGERLGRVTRDMPPGFVGPEACGMRFGEGGGSILAHSAFWAVVLVDETVEEVVEEEEELLVVVIAEKDVEAFCWFDCWFDTASFSSGCRVAALCCFWISTFCCSLCCCCCARAVRAATALETVVAERGFCMIFFFFFFFFFFNVRFCLCLVR